MTPLGKCVRETDTLLSPFSKTSFLSPRFCGSASVKRGGVFSLCNCSSPVTFERPKGIVSTSCLYMEEILIKYAIILVRHGFVDESHNVETCFAPFLTDNY